MSVCAHTEVCKWIDHVTWNRGTQLLYTTFSSFMKSFIQFIAGKLEKEVKLRFSLEMKSSGCFFKNML